MMKPPGGQGPFKGCRAIEEALTMEVLFPPKSEPLTRLYNQDLHSRESPHISGTKPVFFRTTSNARRTMRNGIEECEYLGNTSACTRRKRNVVAEYERKCRVKKSA
jgi:hypothetical protein